MNQTNENHKPNADAKLLLGEVLPNQEPKILIVGGVEAGLTLNVRAQLEKEFGRGIVIISPEEAIEKGLQRQAQFEREPFEIKVMARLIEPYVDRTNNQPWYTKFKKKHKKRR